MPRTFSRGSRFDAGKLLRIHDLHLDAREQLVFDQFMRVRLCPEEGLEEQDLSQLIEDIKTAIQRFVDILRFLDSLNWFLASSWITTWRPYYFATLRDLQEIIRELGDDYPIVV